MKETGKADWQAEVMFSYFVKPEILTRKESGTAQFTHHMATDGGGGDCGLTVFHSVMSLWKFVLLWKDYSCLDDGQTTEFWDDFRFYSWS